ncbi:HAMP domain-containing histidine kinase [Cuneatibacter sp. NSJ-177]|uniref:sensor histidine kinase n=1 Tax=Cuneatibacter sp. NSJ-177 TaxID=2931401 RepID=UPI001FD45DC5|nr:HAMP domain-containing sensor histidine kinase [Cuneatibacter sp. NSJ-177]MCJ7836853.1 HAMP domain-containing histidine kinase [Cuneatibacter sp. NSJ-177]
MIKKLRIKFIALSMFSLLLVLFIIMGSINILNYQDIVKDADSVLSILKSNNGAFPKMEEPRGKHDSPKPLSPETPYESRFFSVLMSREGEVISVDTGKIAAVDTATAMEYAESLWERQENQGFIGDYRYTFQETDEGTRIIFLDCGRTLSTFRSFLFTSCGISLLGLLAVFTLLAMLSGRIIKPFSESYEKQKRFITDAGHELKTPLTIIDADADVLSMEFGENEWIQDIQSQTKRLASLTNDLILLARMDEGTKQVQKIDFPFSDLASEMVQSFQALALQQNKTFSSRIQPMLSLCGDEKSLRQLLSILLDNALKYSDPEGAISLSLEKSGKSIRLTVFNTVENISPESLPHLFERFYRADPSRNSQTGGYGIGLSIAKAIVTSHKGKITASSPDGRSLQVVVVLPEK